MWGVSDPPPPPSPPPPGRCGVVKQKSGEGGGGGAVRGWRAWGPNGAVGGGGGDGSALLSVPEAMRAGGGQSRSPAPPARPRGAHCAAEGPAFRRSCLFTGGVKQDKSSRGSVDTTKTRSGPRRVRMCSGERPIGAAKGKQSDTEALCQPPPKKGMYWMGCPPQEEGGYPPLRPPPPLLPFQCLRLAAKILLQRLRCQEDLRFIKIFGSGPSGDPGRRGGGAANPPPPPPPQGPATRCNAPVGSPAGPPGVGCPGDRAVARAVDQVHPDAHSESMRGFADSSTDLCAPGGGGCRPRLCYAPGGGGGGHWHKALGVGSVSLWRRLLASRP